MIKLIVFYPSPVFENFNFLWLWGITLSSLLRYSLLKNSSMLLILEEKESNGIACILEVKHTHKYLLHPEKHLFITGDWKGNLRNLFHSITYRFWHVVSNKDKFSLCANTETFTCHKVKKKKKKDFQKKHLYIWHKILNSKKLLEEPFHIYLSSEKPIIHS